MMTKDFGMGLFGHKLFDKDSRKELKAKWDAMSDSEKLDFMNKHMQHCGEDRFSVEAMDARSEAWSKMSADEKQAFVDERKQRFEHKMEHKHHHNPMHNHPHFEEELKAKWDGMSDSEKLDFSNKRMQHFDEDRFSVEAIDARSEAWSKMTIDQKEAFVIERKEEFEHKMEHIHHHMHGFFGHMHR